MDGKEAVRMALSSYRNLLERAGQLSTSNGKGSMTSIVLADVPFGQDKYSGFSGDVISCVDDFILVEKAMAMRRVRCF